MTYTVTDNLFVVPNCKCTNLNDKPQILPIRGQTE